MKAATKITLYTLISLCSAAPLSQNSIEDVELTAGYFQGDIVLNKFQQRNGLRSEVKHWPNNTVYYKINDGYFDEEHRNHILRGMQMLEEVSCIRFKEANDDQKYYVNITGKTGGCYSAIGWQNEVQYYNLQPYPLDKGCFRLGTIVHEFLHTLGFFHMQSASNRDEYVHIAFENIKKDMADNFEKFGEDIIDDFDEEYDYDSILHYGEYAFSVNGEKTIIPLKEGVEIGQRRGMSKNDIIRLNTMYRCRINVL